MVVEWKLFWVVLGGVASLATAVLTALFGVPWWLTIAGTVAVAVLFASLANRVVHGSRMFAEVGYFAKRQIVRWMASAAAVHVAWVTAFELRPKMWVVWVLVLGVLAVGEYWICRGHEYLLTQLKPATPSKEHQEAVAQQREADHAEKVFAAALKQAGYGWLTILKWDPVKDFGVRYRVREPSKLALKQLGVSGSPRLTPSSAEEIANGLSEVLDTEIETGWVSLKKERAASTYSIVVVTEDVMARVYPYDVTPEWTSITQPALVGYQLDGEPYYLPLKQHGQAIGQTLFGKSAFIHNLMGHITLCGDAVLWVAGVEKVYDLTGGWIEPYMDSGLPLPIDWICQGQQDTTMMLAALMTAGRFRQNLPMHKRGNWPTIIMVLDEASYALSDRTVTYPYQGKARPAGELAGMVARGVNSGDAHVIYATQQDVNGDFGDSGSAVTANMGWSAGFRSMDEAMLGRLMGNYQLPQPQHKGEYYLNPGNGDMPVHLKAAYMQSADSTKPRLHDGLTVDQVAWSRRNFHTELDPATAKAIDAATKGAYGQRHRRMDAELRRYLTDDTVAEPTLSAAAQDGYERVMAAVNGMTGTPTPDLPVPATGVTSLADHRSRPERIVEIVNSAGRPTETSEIIDALRAAGDDVTNTTAVTNALSELVAAGEIDRPKKGVYVPINQLAANKG